MAFIKSIKEMDKKFSWSFLGFLLAVIFGAITLYLGFYKDNTPDLNFIVTANSSVLDIKENLGSLDVVYKGDSLSKNNQDLRILTFRVINQGSTSILQNFYDVNDPVGFSIKNGKIADDPILLRATNNYLKEKLIITKNADDSVKFSNVILEPNESFEIKVLVLHDVDKNPTIETFGKVAGVNSINVLTSYNSTDNTSIMNRAFGGGIQTNILRFIAFTVLFITLIGLIAAISEKIGLIKKKRKKERLLNVYKEYDSDSISIKDNFFFDYYLSGGAASVTIIYDIMSNPEAFKKKVKNDDSLSRERWYQPFDDHFLFTELKNEGLISDKKGVLEADKARFAVLVNFVSFLRRKGEFNDFPSYEMGSLDEDFKTISTKNKS